MIQTPPQPGVFDNPFRTLRLNHSSDFQPQWDVDSLNSPTSRWMVEEVAKISGRRSPDPGQVIPVILSQPGYGKTHIFGRLAHALGNKALFVFVGAIPDAKRPLEHVRWTVVETLFSAKEGEVSPLHEAMADLFHPSFVDMAKRMAVGSNLQRTLLQRLDAGTKAVLEIVANNKNLASFQKLATSAVARLPHVRSSVVRALALGWSPQEHLVRRWLRGERLSEDESRLVGLDEESPHALDILNGVAAILDYRKPIVICFDQIESALKDAEGPKQLSIQLSELLAGVPNQYLIISCLEDAWSDLYRQGFSQSFFRRVREHKLVFPSDDEALSLIKKRLLTWTQRDPQLDELWPFNRDSLERFIREEKPMPGELMRRCRIAMDAWAAGTATPPLTIGNPPAEPPPAKLFESLWKDEIERVKNDPRRQPDEMQDARIFAGMKECMLLVRSAGEQGSGFRVGELKEAVLASTPTYQRYGMRIEVKDPAGAHSVIAAVTTMTGGNALYYFLREMARAMKSAAGGVLLHPRREFNLGAVGKRSVDKAVAEGKLHILSLKEHRAMFQGMECAMGLLDQARSGELVLGTARISYERCQELMRETKVLDDSIFLKSIAKWNAPAAAPAAESAVAAPRRAASSRRRTAVEPATT